jgi:hypothetical protein
MEFSLEEPHGLTCHQHTVTHDSTDGGDPQPAIYGHRPGCLNLSWEVRESL